MKEYKQVAYFKILQVRHGLRPTLIVVERFILHIPGRGLYEK